MNTLLDLMLLIVVGCGISVSAIGQGVITAPLPDTGEFNTRFKLIQTIVVDAGGGVAHFADTSSQLYTDKYIADGQDCTPCQSIELRNVVSGNVLKTADNLAVSSYSNDARIAMGENLKHGLFGPSYKSSFYAIHGGVFESLFRAKQEGVAQFSNDDRFAAIYGFDGTSNSVVHLKIALYNIQSKKQTAELVASDSISYVGFSDDSQHVLAACEDGTIRVWNAATGALLHTFDVGAGKVSWTAELSNQGVILAAGDSLIKLDSKSGKVIASAPKLDGDWRSSLAISSDGKMLANWSFLKGESPQINIYSTESLARMSTIWGVTAEQSSTPWKLETGNMFFSADNKYFLASGNANDRLPVVSLVRVWRIERD